MDAKELDRTIVVRNNHCSIDTHQLVRYLKE